MAKNSLESRLTLQGDMIIQLNKTILSLQQANAQALENFNAKEAVLLQEIQNSGSRTNILPRSSLANPVRKVPGIWKAK